MTVRGGQLGALLVFALLLRLVHLTSGSLMQDEGYTYLYSPLNPLDIAGRWGFDPNPPLSLVFYWL